MQLLTRGMPAQVSVNASLVPIKGTQFAVPQTQEAKGARDIGWEVLLAGGPPATWQVDIEGNIDDPTDETKWFQIDSTQVVASNIFFIVNQNVTWVRGRLVAIGAGGGSATVKIKV